MLRQEPRTCLEAESFRGKHKAFQITFSEIFQLAEKFAEACGQVLALLSKVGTGPSTPFKMNSQILKPLSFFVTVSKWKRFELSTWQ